MLEMDAKGLGSELSFTSLVEFIIRRLSVLFDCLVPFSSRRCVTIHMANNKEPWKCSTEKGDGRCIHTR